MMTVPRITIEDLKRRIDAHEAVTVLDSRALDAWKSSESQIPGSIRVPPDEVDKHLSEIPRDRLVVPYCTWHNEHSSARVARTLLDAGWTDVRALVGGFDAWRTAGYPVEAKTNERSRSAETPLSIKNIQDNLQKAEGDETDEA